MTRALHRVFLVSLLFVSSASLAAERQELEQLSQALLDEANSVMGFWLEHGPDREFGGFHGSLAADGSPLAASDKGLIQQSRHLWSLSAWHPYAGEQQAEVKRLADASFAFLKQHFLDKDGEFFFKVTRQGEVADPKKLIYAESFAIYGLSEYASAFGSDEAKQLALACFQSLDARVHDAKFKGSDQSNDPGWLAEGAQKGTNTHIHLMEAFTTLYSISGDKKVKARLKELIDVVLYKIVQDEGYAHLEFYRDWRPHSQARVSYGHDLETAWLLLEAYRALGEAPSNKVIERIVEFGSNSAHWGFDKEEGGYFNYGVPAGEIESKEKIWWVQAEAIAGLWALYELSGEEKFIDYLQSTLRYSQAQLKDAQHGGWYWSRIENGELSDRGTLKGEEWKTNYHLLRALVFTHVWIEQYLKNSSL